VSDAYEGSIVRLPSVDYVANMKISSWVSENNPHPLNHHHSGLRFSAELPMSTADGRQSRLVGEYTASPAAVSAAARREQPHPACVGINGRCGSGCCCCLTSPQQRRST